MYVALDKVCCFIFTIFMYLILCNSIPVRGVGATLHIGILAHFNKSCILTF